MIKPTFPEPPSHYKRLDLIPPNPNLLNQVDTIKLFGDYFKVRKINFYEAQETNDPLLKLKNNGISNENLIKKEEERDINLNNMNNMSNENYYYKEIKHNYNYHNHNDKALDDLSNVKLADELKYQVKKLKSQIKNFYSVLSSNINNCGNTLLEIRYTADAIRLVLYALKKKDSLIKARNFFEKEILNQTITHQNEILENIEETKSLMAEVGKLSSNEEYLKIKERIRKDDEEDNYN